MRANNWAAPPGGVWRLACVLREAGHTAVVWDPILDGKPEQELPWDIIGFSVSHHSLPDDVALMNRMASVYPDALIVAGGVEATLNYQQLLESVPRLRYVMLAEGEKAMLSLARGGSPDGVIERRISCLTEDEYRKINAAIDFSIIPYERYWAKTREIYPDAPADDVNTVRLITSSHCNRGCAFCSVTRFHAAAMAGKHSPVLRMPVGDVVNMVEKVRLQAPTVRTIYFCEDDFCSDRNRAADFFRSAPALRYMVQAALPSVDDDLLRVMAAGGCNHLAIGVESCSERVLKSFHKRIDFAKLEHVVKACVQLGMEPYLLFIMFAPATRVEDLWANVRGIRHYRSLGARVSITTLTYALRGTELLNEDHLIEYDLRNGIKQAANLVPDDSDTRGVFYAFRKEVPQRLRELGHAVDKCDASKVMLDVLEEILLRNGSIATPVMDLATLRKVTHGTGMQGVDC